MKNYKNYTQEEYIDLENYDIQKEFDFLNKLLFEGKIKNVPIKLEKNKNSSARVISTRYYNKPEEIKYLGISKNFKMKNKIFRDILAHELIHIYMIQNQIKDFGGYHGIIFKKFMDEINKKGFNVDIVNRSHHSELVDMHSKVKVGSIILHNLDNNTYQIIVMNKNILLENLNKSEEQIRYMIKNRKQKFDIFYLISDYYKLKIFPCFRKYKMSFYLLDVDLYNEIIKCKDTQIFKRLTV